MRRRDFVTLLGGVTAVWPLSARAQQADRMRRIGVLSSGTESDPEWPPQIAAFRQELQTLGWTEGRNVRIDYRWAAADLERMRTYAAELVGLAPDLILTNSNQVTVVVGRQTRMIPIVFATAGDPLETGLVSSMAHPGGNITGFTPLEAATGGKWLELLKEIAPRLTRVAALYTPGGAASLATLRVIEGMAPSLGVQTTSVAARDPAEFERAIEAFSREANGGLIVLSGPATQINREQIIELAARHRLPAIYPFRYYVTDGGLMCYGASNTDGYRRAASYVDRILKGEKPGDLPVQGPTPISQVALDDGAEVGIDEQSFTEPVQQRCEARYRGTDDHAPDAKHAPGLAQRSQTVIAYGEVVERAEQ